MKRVILFIFMVLAAAFACHAADQALPFRLHRNYLILVDCSVANQRGLTAVIDTGTTETLLDVELVRRLSLETRPDFAVSLTQESAAQAVSIRSLELGPIQISHLEGIAMDLASIGRELGVHLDVVVGMDVLGRSNFVVDYQSRLITFSVDPEKIVSARTTIEHSARLLPADRFVLVDSNIFGKSLRLQVDTGTNGLLLYGRSLNWLPHPVSAGAHLAGVSQTSSASTVDSREVRIGNWHSPHLTLSVVESPAHRVAEFDGILGPRALGARRIAFDFTHHMLYWN